MVTLSVLKQKVSTKAKPIKFRLRKPAVALPQPKECWGADLRTRLTIK